MKNIALFAAIAPAIYPVILAQTGSKGIFATATAKPDIDIKVATHNTIISTAGASLITSIIIHTGEAYEFFSNY